MNIIVSFLILKRNLKLHLFWCSHMRSQSLSLSTITNIFNNAVKDNNSIPFSGFNGCTTRIYIFCLFASSTLLKILPVVRLKVNEIRKWIRITVYGWLNDDWCCYLASVSHSLSLFLSPVECVTHVFASSMCEGLSFSMKSNEVNLISFTFNTMIKRCTHTQSTERRWRPWTHLKIELKCC